MSNLLNKGNTFYFIASSLATLTLLTSLALINVPLPLILALATLSVLVLALSYKIISNNKKIEIERSKFAQKVNESEVERESLLKEKESLEQKLEAKINRVFEITGKLEKIMKEKDELGEQEEELLCKISRLCEQLQEKENDIAKKEERITELKRKVDNNKYEELHKEIEKLSKEKERLNKEINKLCKEKHILSNKKEELYKRQEELYVELDELQLKIKKIEKEKEKLSKELKKKFEELRDANDCINSQCCELDGIRKDCGNEVKKLQDSLLEKSSKIEQLQKGLREVVSFIQRAMQHITCEVEEPIRRNGDNNIEAVLKKVYGETQVTKSLLKELKEKAAECLSDENVSSFEEDLGYASRSPTPTRLSGSVSIQSIASGPIPEYGL